LSGRLCNACAGCTAVKSLKPAREWNKPAQSTDRICSDRPDVGSEVRPQALGVSVEWAHPGDPSPP
jgi:hypothetical protein